MVLDKPTLPSAAGVVGVVFTAQSITTAEGMVAKTFLKGQKGFDVYC